MLFQFSLKKTIRESTLCYLSRQNIMNINKTLQGRTGTSARFPVAPQQRKAKQCKILIFNENRDFLFSPKTQKSAVHDCLWWSRRWSKRVFQTSPP